MGGAENMGTQVGRTLPDACRASPVVAAVTLVRRGGNRGSNNVSRLRFRGAGETGRGQGGGGGEREQTKWERVVDLAQTAFWGGVLEEEATCQAVVLIPKWGGKYHSIGLMKVLWKAEADIINCRFTASITNH